MNAYIYNASMYCEDCAEEIMEDLEEPEHYPDVDSNEYPAGPYSEGGGESDSPQHCNNCNVFLENPLTDEGEEYVRETVERRIIEGTLNDVTREWRDFYGVDLNYWDRTVEVAEEMEDRALEFLTELGKHFEGTEAEDNPYRWSGDRVAWWLAIDDWHARIEVVEERDYEGDEAFGINFAFSADKQGGEVIAHWAPYNFTDQCWVNVFDEEGVNERADAFFSALDAETVAESLREELEDMEERKKNREARQQL